jgi:hypothetical protein
VFNIKTLIIVSPSSFCTEAPCLERADQIDALPTTTGESPVRTPKVRCSRTGYMSLIVGPQSQHSTLNSEVLRSTLNQKHLTFTPASLTPRGVMHTVLGRIESKEERPLYSSSRRSGLGHRGKQPRLWYGRAGPYNPDRLCHGRVPQLSDQVPSKFCRKPRWSLRRSGRQYRMHAYLGSAGRSRRE